VSGLKQGDFNLAVGVIGNVGTGKSTWAITRALELQRTIPCYVLAHDAGYRLPARLPDGAPTGITRHETIEAVRAAMKTKPGGVHALATDDAAPVLDLAVEIAAKSMQSSKHRRCPPVVVLIDEIVLLDDATPYRLGTALKKVLARRRHLHVGIIWTCQSAHLVHYQMMTLSTEMVLFRQRDQRDLTRLNNGGIEAAYTAQLPALHDYKQITVKTG
jgi:hypothetical protein